MAKEPISPQSGASDRKQKKRRRRRKVGNPETHEKPVSVENGESTSQHAWKDRLPTLSIAGMILAASFAWAYWPTLVNLVRAWHRIPDYSHGYLVAPAAALFLWLKRDRFPGLTGRLAWPGLILIGLSVAIRMFGARYFVDAIDGWSILFWVAGAVWLLAGWRVLWWSLPSVAFLWFAIPLPWRVERWLSLPLQGMATKLSCWGLQFLGQPALAEGHTIYINDFPLMIEEACSGLRIFVGIVALAFAYLILFRRTWWEKALLLASALPIALVANATRIVTTGVLSQYASSESAYAFMHTFWGLVMVPYAAGLFALVLWYVGKLAREVEVVDIRQVVRREGV